MHAETMISNEILLTEEYIFSSVSEILFLMRVKSMSSKFSPSSDWNSGKFHGKLYFPVGAIGKSFHVRINISPHFKTSNIKPVMTYIIM